MIQKIGKVTLYVSDQQKAKQFWVNKAGFIVILEQTVGEMTWLEVAPNSLAQTSFVLYDKKLMERDNPELNTGNPSVLLSADEIQATHERMKKNGIKVGELMNLPYGSMFSFEDQDGNEFIVREK